MPFPGFLRSQIAYCELSRRAKTSDKDPESFLGIIQANTTGAIFEKSSKVLSEPETYYGFTAGACTGFALKKVAKAAAFTFGTVFMGFQLAAQSGYVNVNWSKVEKDVKKYFPENPNDESSLIHESVRWLTTNTGIAATVFSAGFVAGLKIG